MNNMKSIGIKLLEFLVNVLRIAFVLFIFLMLILFLSQFIEDIGRYPYLEKINSVTKMLGQTFLDQIKLIMPYKYEGTDYSPVLFIVVLIILVNFCIALQGKLLQIRQGFITQQNYYDWRKRQAQSLSKEKLNELDNKFELLNAAKLPGQRKKLLKEFAILKSRLDIMGQQLAFLAIDIVDSTDMIADEASAHDLERYNQLVDESLKEHGVVKYTRTPEGIMSCFRTVDDAVLAAKALLKNLKKFNSTEKTIKQDLQIRCGISAGFVYMDDDTPLEQISDRVIDIAKDLQKYAKPNCINIAAIAIEPLKGRGGFDETADVIDDQKVYQWPSK